MDQQNFKIMLSYNQLFENNYSSNIEVERDRILDKIASQGIDSLSDYEKRFLDSFKDGNQEEIYNNQNKTFEDEMFKFILDRIEPYDGEEGGTRYRGVIKFKEYGEELVGSIVETEDGRVISSFRLDSEKTDYDIVDPEDIYEYDDFLQSIADQLREEA